MEEVKAEEKSLSVGIREFRDTLVKTINDSGLPIDVIDMVLGELRSVVHSQAEMEYQSELKKIAEKAGTKNETRD